MSIPLSKAEHAFLKLGLRVEEFNNTKLATYMVDEGRVFTTNGYCLNSISMPVASERGYYLWSAESSALWRVSELDIQGRSDLIDGANKVRRDTIEMLNSVPALPILSFKNGYPQEDLIIDTRATKDATIVFRKGMYRGKEHAICLGINPCVFEWNENGSGETRSMDSDRLALFDVKLLMAVAKDMKQVGMQWDETNRNRAVIFTGGQRDWQSIVMQMHMPRSHR